MFRLGETLHFKKHAVLLRGHHFSKQALRLGHIHVFKFMFCFVMAKQHFQHAHVNQKKSMGNKQPWIKPKQPRFQNQWIAKAIENTKQKTINLRFQNQWVAKTIEKTNKTKKTKISEPMGNQSHREYTKKQTTKFQDQWFWFTIIGSEI